MDTVKGGSVVEAHILEHLSPHHLDKFEPTEKIRVLTVDNFPALGQATAFRFLEWVQQHPTGVCSLPTGKTPEFFIKWVTKIMQEWGSTDEMKKLCTDFGLKDGDDPTKKPNLSDLTFVQIDEFFPMDPEQRNSFNWYVREFYLDKGFGMKEEKAMLMDCSKIGIQELVALSSGTTFGLTNEPEDAIVPTSMEDVFPPDQKVDLTLRVRDPVNRLERVQQRVIRNVDQWCVEYEQKIRSLGGIGFILLGIGPDGHVAFNCQGSDHNCTTRLDELNYKSQAAASGDLGGITVVRKRKVITIGLGTITYNKDCVAVLQAAGEAKAGVIRDAVQSATPHVLHPATALWKLQNAVFYITVGAGKLLSARYEWELAQTDAGSKPFAVYEKVLVDLCIRRRKRLIDLTMDDINMDRCAQLLIPDDNSLRRYATSVHDSLTKKVENGCRVRSKSSFLHTEPHHDDIMLGYLPVVLRATQPTYENKHHFVCATSGFNSVSNPHMLELLERCEKFIRSGTWQRLTRSGAENADYFCPNHEGCVDYRRRDVWKYSDGIAAADEELRGEGAARRLIFNIGIIFQTVVNSQGEKILEKIQELKTYFLQVYPGQRDTPEIQTLKGSCREFEAECIWGYLGWQIPDVSHLRLGFYTADIFSPEPTHDRDVQPILDLMNRVSPDVVTVALDPEGSGPDTHYKVLQAVTSAVEKYCDTPERRKDVTVWGYRNVWFKFDPSEVSTIIPVSLETIATTNDMFLQCFESQKNAEFPAYEIQGPFCEMSRKVQVEQYSVIETCLGYEWFHKHPDPVIRAARGLVFLKEMNVEQLLKESLELRQQAENF